MSDSNDVTYTVDFVVRRRNGLVHRPAENGPVAGSIPRIARLMALAIRLDGLVRKQSIPDYAEVARRGRVTRARMTQIMQLLDLAPDLQERLLFLPPGGRLKERNLRPVVRCLDWDEQRRLIEKLIGPERKIASGKTEIPMKASKRPRTVPKKIHQLTEEEVRHFRPQITMQLGNKIYHLNAPPRKTFRELIIGGRCPAERPAP